MRLLPFEGFMIPGLNFQDCSIWILNWSDNPTPYKKLIEVWVLWYDGRKECYINPSEAETILQKYHSFDNIIPADINILEKKDGIDIRISVDEKEIFALNLKFKKSLKYRIINFIIKRSNKDKIGEKGKTETGTYYHNLPKKIIPIQIDKAEFIGTQLVTIVKPKVEFSLGDGKPSDEPIINYCTHMLEE